MVVALPSGHVLASRGGRDSAVFLKDLAAETFIVYARKLGPGLFNATIAACHAAGFDPRLGHETPNSALAINLVAAGLGVSIVQASMRRMQLDGVTYRHLKGRIQPKAGLCLASRRGEPSAAVRQFVNLVRRAAKDFDPRYG